MLRIDLTRADTEPLEFHERLDLPAETGGEDVVSADAVELEGTAEKSERGFTVRGAARGAARLRCVRCLTEFPFTFSETFELSLLHAAGVPREEEVRLDRDELEVRFYDEPELDLVELAVEQFVLAVPMKALCSEECRGLCPRCGADLNRFPCACRVEKDGRWAPLLDWRPRS
ncbi:MAG: DUF177 domain-containing protein [Acidobacteria bacterium]|nr:DUF177 domain-containing protein [Acidobacteriota bacterium]